MLKCYRVMSGLWDALPVGLIDEIAGNSDVGKSSARSHMLHSLQLHQSADNRHINYGSQVAHKVYSRRIRNASS
jgi:hypothetical protein